jgi:hypothetical protein
MARALWPVNATAAARSEANPDAIFQAKSKNSKAHKIKYPASNLRRNRRNSSRWWLMDAAPTPMGPQASKSEALFLA